MSSFSFCLDKVDHLHPRYSDVAPLIKVSFPERLKPLSW